MGTPDDSDQTPPLLQDELARGEECLAAGETEDALMRAARALAIAPDSLDAVSFADRAIAQSPDALTVLALSPGVAFGIAAVHARALAASGRRREAIELAARLAAFRPDLPYLPWTLEWIDESFRAPDAPSLVRPLLDAIAAADDVSPGMRANADAAALLLASESPGSRSVRTSVIRARFLRLAGRLDDAIEEASNAHEAFHSWLTATELAAAHRQAGRIDDALRCLEEAARLDPTDATASLDAGDLLFQARRFAEARKAYEVALQREPGNSWSKVTILFIDASQGDERARAQLVALSKTSGNAGERARQLLSRV